MRKILIAVSFFMFMNLGYGQFPGFGGSKGPTIKGKIEGTVIDSISGQPVEFASLALRKEGSDAIINGTISEEGGVFKFTEVKDGVYDLTVSFLGYQDKVVKAETTLKNPDLKMGNIILSPSLNLLEEIEITADKVLIENRADKLVFNAENDASIAGGDATDVLRKVPMLSVDLDGNVSMRGSSNIQILVNGKPSGMFASSPSEALKMFPADQIKQVEVITSPSAKYDAEGTGGIINIITKGDSLEGIAGTVSASVGNRQNNGTLNLNMGKGRFGATINGGVFYMIPNDAESSFYRESNLISGPPVIASNEGVNTTGRLGFNGSASMFYDFNAYHAINTSFSLRGFGFTNESTTTGYLDNPLAMFEDQFTRTNDGSNLNSGFDWTTDYTMKFENHEDRELVFATQYSQNVSDQEYTLEEIHEFGLPDRIEDVNNDGTNDEITLQVDYTHPFGKKIKLETGAKTIIRDITSDYDYDVLEDGMYVEDSFRSNVFEYDQDVIAGYGSMTFFLPKKFSLITGLRYERTDIAGDYVDGSSKFTNSYDNWLPNATLSKSLPKFRTLKLSYSQRISRPSLNYINPFNNQQDLYNQTLGNPFLEPEITNQFELNYNFSFKGIMVFASTYYKHTDDIIESTIGVNDMGVSINSFDNVGTNNSVGINLFSSKTIDRLTLRGGGDVYTYNAKGTVNGEELEAKDIQYRLFFNGDYKITGTLKADFYGFFMSPRRTLQGTNPSFSIMGVGLRKEFKNFSLGVRVVEPFRPTKSFDSSLSGDDFNQETTFEIPFQSFGVDIRYKFGKVDFKERKSKVKNTDLKSGGDGGQGQQSGGGMGN